MLYTIFIYQTQSGLLIYDKSFQDISSGKMELFSSFFSAIKSFISEMVLGGGSTELKNIELGDYTVLITSINSIEADLVIISDKDDIKIINKLIPKIIKILQKHQQTFLEWDGNRSLFDVLDQPFTNLISSKKQLIGETTLIENPELVLKSMWAHKGELTAQESEGLNQERDFLINRLGKSQNLLRKSAISEKILDLSERLKDDLNFIKFQNEVKNLKDQIKDTKLKLRYYLEKIKSSLSKAVDNLGTKSIKDGDYKDAYLNLYSFTTKLKLIEAGRNWEKYREYANILINKAEIDDHELSAAISAILRMSNDIDDYIDLD